MDRARALSVAQVNRYIKGLFENDALLCELRVEGELSNFKRHGSGHLYFTLKDGSAALNCVMFASYAAGLSFEPKSGNKVIVSGHISLYEKTGQYQLYAAHMKPAGEGDLAAAFIKLRDSLKAEGLFEPERKKPIPAWVNCVALVTSPTGAAVQDMIKVIHGRSPGVKIIVVPALVQGENAAADIVRAIHLAETTEADVIIVGRGGGSMEDLQAFNEEIVARAIAASRLPVVSAVGHETDFTIVDFVADFRAPTPSAAAVAVVTDISEQLLKARALRQRADRAVSHACLKARARLQALSKRPCLTRPLDAVLMRQLHTQQLSKDMERIINQRLRDRKTTLENCRLLLEKLSPFTLWKRGYTVVCAEDGTGLRSVKDMFPEQAVTLHMQDGDAAARILDVKPH
jgi:exodeoxyribonuclease VII large subunit